MALPLQAGRRLWIAGGGVHDLHVLADRSAGGIGAQGRSQTGARPAPFYCVAAGPDFRGLSDEHSENVGKFSAGLLARWTDSRGIRNVAPLGRLFVSSPLQPRSLNRARLYTRRGGRKPLR